jgi:hypothetical protein
MSPTPTTSAKPRRHVWRWVFLGLGLCLTPFLILAIVAASFLTLPSDARVLRKHVMAATDSNWHTKVQVDLGSLSLAAVRTGLAFVHNKDVADAKLALAAVKHASVGVYMRDASEQGCSRERLFTETDQAMQQRGWSRLVGVADGKDNVLVYVSQNIVPDEPIDICVAVVNGQELVVVSTSIDASKLTELVERHMPEGGLKEKLRLTKL